MKMWNLIENPFLRQGTVAKVNLDSFSGFSGFDFSGTVLAQQESYKVLVNQRLDALMFDTVMVHPLDAPFVRAVIDGRLPEFTISRLWNECGRKYAMGAKRGIAKWGTRELIAQYKARLGQ